MNPSDDIRITGRIITISPKNQGIDFNANFSAPDEDDEDKEPGGPTPS